MVYITNNYIQTHGYVKYQVLWSINGNEAMNFTMRNNMNANDEAFGNKARTHG